MANVKISELPNATSLNSGDSFPVVQGGVTKQAARSVLFASPTFTGTTAAAILTATGDVTFDGGAFVFNESGADKDARFEGDTDANLLFLDASTDRVGIGTSLPGAKLDVNGSGRFNGTMTASYASGFDNTYISQNGATGNGCIMATLNFAQTVYQPITYDASYYVWRPSGTERMRLDTSGNLGIGTNAPAAKLDVDGAAIVRGFFVSADAIKLGANTSAPSATDAFVYRPADNTLAFGTASNERMRLDSSGNLGIGTSSPVGKIDSVSNATAAFVARASTTGANQTVDALTAFNSDASLYALARYNAVQHIWRYAGTTEGMRLNLSGNLGIGTASPTGQLHLAGANAQQIFRTDQSTSGYTYTQGLDDTGAYFLHNSSSRSFRWAPNSVAKMELDASGNLFCQGVYDSTSGSAANVFVASNGLLQRSTSSLKYKTDIQDAAHGLADVMRLRPVTYKSKTDGDRVFGGLIAEEVHSAGLTEFVQYADDGSPDALAYGNMVSLLTKAIQEQQAVINELRARVAALEAG